MIYLASDHAGFELKESLRKWLVEEGYEVKDFGAFSLIEKDDYPDFIKPLAKEISENPNDAKGIILGGSGQGEAITANRFKNVRAVVYYGGQKEIIKLSREHNDANILSLGARFLSKEEAKDAVKIWLETSFSSEGDNERHLKRIKKID
ncbi:MAG: RpiB/LacA/LacB family sugar-phosphate isomerase [Candidatus Marinimicrobia bacterium]|nr:RpiB/LacA/LacB family sugar-phosphate isomerase [Candidatus Neomarinimicrobiota bacterium]